jgi:two-component system cell cycle response regulator
LFPRENKLIGVIFLGSEDQNKTVFVGGHAGTGTEAIEPAGPALAQASGVSVAVYLLSRGTELSVGRAPDNDVCLPDLNVSQHHARVRANADGVIVIEDLKSTNGIFVNGERVTQRTLGDGDLVLIRPQYLLKFRCQASPIPETSDNDTAGNDKSDAAKVVRTGLQGRQDLLMQMDESLFQTKTRDKNLALLMFEVDHLEAMIKAFGPAAGDWVLDEMTKIVNSVLDQDDVFAQYENHIFGVLLRNRDEAAAAVVAQRIRRGVKYHEFVYEGRKIPVTVSLGIGLAEKQVKNPMDFLSATLANLAKARRAGRDTINGRRQLRDVVGSLAGKNVA